MSPRVDASPKPGSELVGCRVPTEKVCPACEAVFLGLGTYCRDRCRVYAWRKRKKAAALCRAEIQGAMTERKGGGK